MLHPLLLGFLLMTWFAADAIAETRHDEGLWLMVVGQGRLCTISKDLSILAGGSMFSPVSPRMQPIFAKRAFGPV